MDVGCIAIPSRLLACGSDERAQERLGSATRVLGATELVEDRDELDMAQVVYRQLVRMVVSAIVGR